MAGSILGNAVRRREDPGILRGETRYLDDLPFAGLHVVFVRAMSPHARLVHVDVGDARGMPGVVDVVTAHDLVLEPQNLMMLVPPAFARPPIARDVVRFVGDIVAVVVAETRAQAVDAAEAVVVDDDPLPAVVDPEAARAPDAPVLFADAGTNVVMAFGDDADQGALDDAEVVVRARLVNQRVAAAPLEVNGCIAEPAGDGLTVWVSTQNAFGVRDSLARSLGVAPESIRVVAPAVGGGFGAKMGACPEYLVVAALARRLERPVKWVETRSENMVAMGHGRGQVQHVELGLTRDGRMTGLKARVVQDAGAYPQLGAFLPYHTRQMASAVYRLPKVDVATASVATNTTPVTAYRGAGRPEATALVERVVDMAAQELGLDPVELRRRNLVPPDAFPYHTPTGAVYDVGDYARALDEALRVADYDGLRAEQARRRAAGDRTLLGIGVACYVEVTAPLGITGEFASVEVERDGGVTLKVGTSSHGQGHETAFSQIVADRLGVPMESIRFVQSDTGEVREGSGTMGSRSLQIAGSAVLRASEAVLEKAKRLASELLEADPRDIVVHDSGTVGVVGVPSRGLTWAELAAAAWDDERRPGDMPPGLGEEEVFDQGASTYPFGAHVAVVEVDADTGRVRLVRHVAVDDCGRVLNPLLVTGQVHGGVGQGAAQALFEQVVYDDDGNPLTATFMDYAFPSAAELPSWETAHTETPTHLNPLGAKGIGESGTIGSTPAIWNAVVDACAHLGVRNIDMPLTAERVWHAIRDAEAAGR